MSKFFVTVLFLSMMLGISLSQPFVFSEEPTVYVVPHYVVETTESEVFLLASSTRAKRLANDTSGRENQNDTWLVIASRQNGKFSRTEAKISALSCEKAVRIGEYIFFLLSDGTLVRYSAISKKIEKCLLPEGTSFVSLTQDTGITAITNKGVLLLDSDMNTLSEAKIRASFAWFSQHGNLITVSQNKIMIRTDGKNEELTLDDCTVSCISENIFRIRPSSPKGIESIRNCFPGDAIGDSGGYLVYTKSGERLITFASVNHEYTAADSVALDTFAFPTNRILKITRLVDNTDVDFHTSPLDATGYYHHHLLSKRYFIALAGEKALMYDIPTGAFAFREIAALDERGLGYVLAVVESDNRHIICLLSNGTLASIPINGDKKVQFATIKGIGDIKCAVPAKGGFWVSDNARPYHIGYDGSCTALPEFKFEFFMLAIFEPHGNRFCIVTMPHQIIDLQPNEGFLFFTIDPAVMRVYSLDLQKKTTAEVLSRKYRNHPRMVFGHKQLFFLGNQGAIVLDTGDYVQQFDLNANPPRVKEEAIRFGFLPVKISAFGAFVETRDGRDTFCDLLSGQEYQGPVCEPQYYNATVPTMMMRDEDSVFVRMHDQKSFCTIERGRPGVQAIDTPGGTYWITNKAELHFITAFAELIHK